jgi:uncharacterized protein (TIGR00725 family)
MTLSAVQKRKMIGVIGGNICTSEESKIAEKVGELIAKSGILLICGGMGGVMEAACKGASNAGGLTIGILPSDDINKKNPYIDIPIVTGMGIGRNIIIVRTADALIAINGKYGTLSEISFALQLNKPVFALQPWLAIPGVKIVKTPEMAVNLALNSI